MTPLERIESKLTWLDDLDWGKRDVIEKGGIITRDVANAFVLVYQNVRGDAAMQAEAGAAFKEAYTKHVAPMDLPGVGPVIENMIDAYLPSLLAGLPVQIDAFLDKKILNPAPAPTPE